MKYLYVPNTNHFMRLSSLVLQWSLQLRGWREKRSCGEKEEPRNIMYRYTLPNECDHHAYLKCTNKISLDTKKKRKKNLIHMAPNPIARRVLVPSWILLSLAFTVCIFISVLIFGGFHRITHQTFQDLSRVHIQTFPNTSHNQFPKHLN